MIEGLSVDSGIKLSEADRIQNAAGRTILGLFRTTSVEVARGELGWLSLSARREIRLLRYWGKLVKMDDTRLVKQIFRNCKDRTSKLKGSFCYTVQKLLGSLDLGHLWKTEMIGEPKQWEAQLRKSIKQKDKLCWLAALQDKTKLRTYRILE